MVEIKVQSEPSISSGPNILDLGPILKYDDGGALDLVSLIHILDRAFQGKVIQALPVRLQDANQ
jgi:hypothetical protein